MIIVEGPDGAGKTSLCTKLKGDGVVHTILESPARRLNSETLYTNSFDYLLDYTGRNKVAVDRFFFSELVYGPVLRGKISFNVYQFRKLLSEILSNDNRLVFCLPHHLNFKQDENPEVIEKAYDLHKRYSFLFDIFGNLTSFRSEYPIAFRYNWEDPESYPALLKFLEWRNS